MVRVIKIPDYTWVIQVKDYVCETHTWLPFAKGNHDLVEHEFFFEAWVKARKDKFNLVFDKSHAGFSVNEALKYVKISEGQQKFDEIVTDFIEFRGMMKAETYWQKNQDGTLDVFVNSSNPICLGKVSSVEEAINLLKK